MAWTQAEVDQIRAAILALATGTRVASVSYGGDPSRSISYVPADLPELRRLLAEAESSLAGGKYRRVAFSKGFDS